MASEPRSRATRARAEAALVRFALLAGDHARDFVVIGGLNPDFLAPSAPVAHQGTTDVDLLFELGFAWERDDFDFAWLDAALSAGGFRNPRDNGWRWDAVLGDSLVRLELLCDVPDNPGRPVALPGATHAAPQNLRGPGPALTDPVMRELVVPEPLRGELPDAPASVMLRFANLGGYLLAKSAAALGRDADKDKYDLMYVVLYNDAGSRGAADAVREQLERAAPSDAGSTIRAAMARLVDPSGDWAGSFAASMQESGDESAEEQLRNDAAFGARQFLVALDEATEIPADG